MSSYPRLSQDEIETITFFFQYIDTDHDGFVSVTEIQDACVVDYNGDGVVDAEERVRAGLPWMTDFFNQQDLDGDIRLTLHELLKFNNDTKYVN